MVFPTSEQENITADHGKIVTLTFRAPNSIVPIIVVEWDRADLEDKNAFIYWNHLPVSEEQHTSFVNPGGSAGWTDEGWRGVFGFEGCDYC